ncbi:hypothetical protein PCL1606_57520 [Pseudomonas chlororaphis]|uniref:Uncharacterized protein n=1 Tax=Pseudomonas chlororaphis TaxID=587753 RepID=A0A0D5Y8B3_9PSED|nr:hypothetical protein PCL1606_57520 [Pseudomonas chlororaphis]
MRIEPATEQHDSISNAQVSDRKVKIHHHVRTKGMKFICLLYSG